MNTRCVEKYVKLPSFRDRLQHAMSFENLNAKELAKKAGCSPNTIYEALNKRQNKGPRMSTLYKWANALDFDYEWLALGKMPEQSEEAKDAEIPLEEYLAQHADELEAEEDELRHEYVPFPLVKEGETDDANDGTLSVVMNISGVFNAQEVRDLVSGLGNRRIKIEATISAI